MLDPDPTKRPDASEIFDVANKLLKNKADEAKKLIGSLIQNLKSIKQGEYEKSALKEGRDYFRKSHGKTKASTAHKKILRCRYCKAEFSYVPLWCKCGRPAHTADGPTFITVP
jgi:hypothetical protein